MASPPPVDRPRCDQRSPSQPICWRVPSTTHSCSEPTGDIALTNCRVMSGEPGSDLHVCYPPGSATQHRGRANGPRRGALDTWSCSDGNLQAERVCFVPTVTESARPCTDYTGGRSPCPRLNATSTRRVYRSVGRQHACPVSPYNVLFLVRFMVLMKEPIEWRGCRKSRAS